VVGAPITTQWDQEGTQQGEFAPTTLIFVIPGLPDHYIDYPLLKFGPAQDVE
jgi:hypothetical protein